MGAIMQDNSKTIGQICGGDAKTIAAVQKFLLRTFPDTPRGKDTPLSEKDIEVVLSAPALSRSMSDTRKNVKRVRAMGVAPNEDAAPIYPKPISINIKQEADDIVDMWQSFLAANGDNNRYADTEKTPDNATETAPQDRTFLEYLLGGIVLGHAFLIWYDCAVQWDTPGIIGGCLAFCIVLAALLLAADKTRVRTSDTALWFVALVDCLAVFVHYPTFSYNARIGDIQTWVLSVFLASVSWVALYLFRDYNQD